MSASSNFTSFSNNTSVFSYHKGFSVTFILVSSTIFVFGVLGNTTLISSILKIRKLRSSPTFIVLLSMAVSDLLRVSFIGLHLNLQLAYGSWIAGNLWCQIFLFIMLTMAHTGNSHVALIAVFRYVILVHPFFTKKFVTTKITMLICGGIWMCLSLFNIPMAMSTGVVTTVISGKGSITCQPTSRVVYVIRCFSCYLIPLAIICSFHICKMVKLSKGLLQTQSMTNGQKKKKYQVSNRSVVLIILVFIIFWLPKAIVWFLAGAFGFNINGGIILTLSSCMSYTNSALNPIIYFFSVKNLRRNVCCKKRQTPDQTSTECHREYISLSNS